MHVVWNASDSGSGVDASTCHLKMWDGGGPSGWETLSVECAGETTRPAELGHIYNFRLSASDNVSNTASAEVLASLPRVTKYYYPTAWDIPH